ADRHVGSSSRYPGLGNLIREFEQQTRRPGRFGDHLDDKYLSEGCRRVAHDSPPRLFRGASRAGRQISYNPLAGAEKALYAPSSLSLAEGCARSSRSAWRLAICDFGARGEK